MDSVLTILGVFPISEVRTGGQKRYIELARQLHEKGHRIFHICRPSLAQVLPGEAIGIIPDELSGYLVPRWLRYRFWIRRRLSAVTAALRANGIERPDLVLTFGETNYFASQAAAAHFGVPLVFALRNNFVDELRTLGPLRRRLPVLRGLETLLQERWYLLLERSICRGADRVVFQSEHDRDVVLARHPKERAKGVVIPNSFRVSWLPQGLERANAGDSLRRGIYVGHLNERKGVRFLFEALKELRGRIPFDIVGFGGLEAWCRAFVEDHGLSESVRFHGRVDRPLELLSQADLMVVPSLFDSFPNTVLEALYVGVPVIGSDAAGIRTMLQEDRLLVPRGDTLALARRLAALVEDPEEYRAVRDACVRRREVFDFDWGERWVGLFGEVLGS